jgi:hypothetical protein
MKRMGMLLAMAVLAGSLLSGCVVVPLGGWHGGGGHSHGRPSPPHYRGR